MCVHGVMFIWYVCVGPSVVGCVDVFSWVLIGVFVFRLVDRWCVVRLVGVIALIECVVLKGFPSGARVFRCWVVVGPGGLRLVVA